MQQHRDGHVPDLGFDPSDPGSVAARRSEILALEEAAAAMLAAGTALQLRAHAAAYEFGHALDVAEGCAESAMHVRSIANEVGLLVKLAAGTAQGHLASASVTLREFPALALALEENLATPAQVTTLASVGLKVNHADPDEQSARRAEFLQVMLERVRVEPLPPRALQKAAERVAEELTGESIDDRYERAKKRRRATVEDLGDGMSVLRVLMSSFVANAVLDRARKQGKAVIKARPKPGAQAATGAGAAADANANPSNAASGGDSTALAPDERTLDQVMSDVIADMLLTSDPMAASLAKGIQAIAHISIPATTMLAGPNTGGPGSTGLAPALLDGMSPMPLEEAKRLAATAPAFIRVLTHPVTGAVQAVDSYKPTTAMRAFLQARDIHCRFIGCRQPAARCELDHTKDHQYGGETAVWNLSDFCLAHHIVKHHTAWKVRQLGGGVLEWTTPSGKIYIDRPEPYDVIFRPSDELPRMASGRPTPGAASATATTTTDDHPPGDDLPPRPHAPKPPPF
ncbi:HNH endonuclease signature motif containing protein [Pseudoclavibacter sp. JSM 162008]|uniref:HNH endonuclease signature motif containing protein n=1 Tax=Pseudoclavibacter sp. JSM 162008 TaxID=3229855 RepID=UPI003524DE6F